jgi:sugar phosphate isomerase/epimerase
VFILKLSISVTDEADKTTPFVLRGDYADSIRIASEIGYDAVELHIRDPKSVDMDLIRNLCEKHGIAVSSLGTGKASGIDGLSFMSSDDGTRKKTLERMKDFISAGKTLNAVVIIGLIRGVIPPDGDYTACEERVRDMLKRCLETAEKLGVTLVFEAINRYESNFLVGIGNVVSFIKRFDSERLKVHIDTFHMNIEEPDMTGSIIKYGKYIGHVHFADSDRMYPGHGHIKFDEIMDALKKICYKGYIAIECLAFPSPIEAARKSWEYLQQFLCKSVPADNLFLTQ